MIQKKTIAAPVLSYRMAGASAEKTLTYWKIWLFSKNAKVMMILFLALGVNLVGNRFGGLF